ncbi:hypothetical protein BH20CHL4_BH20CHL4_01550 [soil metagenome]
MRQLFAKLNPFRSSDSRFGRYYAGVIGPGPGYPTADEARRDLRKFDRHSAGSRWMA